MVYFKQANFKMKQAKKTGLGLIIAFSMLITLLVLLPASRALAVAQPFSNNKIFSGAHYTLNPNGTITTTLTDNTTTGTTNYPLVFTDSTPNNSSHVYVSDKTYFCKAQTDFRDNVAATITLSGAPSGQTITGQLSAWVLGQGASACTNNSGQISINNTNPGSGGSGGLPQNITWNGNTYKLISSAFPLYGLNGGVKGSNCYGGSVIYTDSSSTSGTAFVGLSGNGGVTSLNPSLISLGASSNVLNLVTGCGFTDPKANTAGYSGTITSGHLNAPTPSDGLAGTDCTSAGPGATQGGYTCVCGSSGCVWEGGPTSSSDSGDDTSKCIASSHTTLEWILCPMTTALSKFTDLIIGSVEDQLNFNVSQMLPNSGSHTEVKRAWTIIKDLVSAALVITMLVMVISQAMGGGPFEAYTIRKMLPRLVTAIILMQVSWYLCRYIIGLSNDLGLGIKQLLTAAFGTAGNLDLPSLLHHLDPKAAFITEFSFWGLMLAGILIGASVMLPIILMLVLAVTLAVLVGLASIAFRNLLIIALVIFSPVALLLWVMPGQSMQGYWKKYIDNFTKLLFLFPLMMAMIYSGRIMAWIAGGLGTWGPVDLLIVLVGFFGPLLLLPKAFKWGGSWLAAANNAIASNKVFSKGREVGNRELGGWLDRSRRRYGKEDLNPAGDPDYARLVRDENGKVVGYKGKLGKTMLKNVRAGRFFPTKRSLGIAMQRGNEWSKEQDELALGRVSRAAEVAEKEGGIIGYRLGKVKKDKAGNVIRDANGNAEREIEITSFPKGQRGGTSALKTSFWNQMGMGGREAKASIMEAIRTQSWPEMAGQMVPVRAEAAADLRARGRRVYVAPDGQNVVHERDLDDWARTLDTVDGLYGQVQGKIPMNAAHILEGEGLVDKYTVRDKKTGAVTYRPSREAAQVLETMNGYISAGNSESQYRIIRQEAEEDPHVAKAFVDMIARVADTGQAGLGMLGGLASTESTANVVDGILNIARQSYPGVDVPNLHGYIERARDVQIGRAPATRTTGASSGGTSGGDSGPSSEGGSGASGGSGPTPNRPSGGGYSPGGASTRPGSVSFGSPSAQYTSGQPVELKIDHDALSATIMEATRRGAKLGTSQALNSQSNEVAPTVTSPRSATWRGHAGDQPVRVIGNLGVGEDGKTYYQVEGSSTGIPEDQLEFNDN